MRSPRKALAALRRHRAREKREQTQMDAAEARLNAYADTIAARLQREQLANRNRIR